MYEYDGSKEHCALPPAPYTVKYTDALFFQCEGVYAFFHALQAVIDVGVHVVLVNYMPLGTYHVQSLCTSVFGRRPRTTCDSAQSAVGCLL